MKVADLLLQPFGYVLLKSFSLKFGNLRVVVDLIDQTLQTACRSLFNLRPDLLGKLSNFFGGQRHSKLLDTLLFRLNPLDLIMVRLDCVKIFLAFKS